MNAVIVEGKSWPFTEPYKDIESYSKYFHSHVSFAVRFCDQAAFGHDILGCFYIKPNFPVLFFLHPKILRTYTHTFFVQGRCDHISNGGFITNPQYRGCGIGTFMGQAYLKLAKDLGYRASLFNLVFANNTPSIRLWTKLG